jgi:Bifunctional DNA primase/polymerase, N-terminal
MANPSNNLTCAARLAAAGLSVFPVKASTRTPIFRGWRKRSSNDAATVAQWWQQYPHALPALDLGKCALVVLDGDRHGTVDGVAALRDLVRQQPGFNASGVPTVRTPRDGVHLYFKQGDPPFGNHRGNLPAGIDVRGHGGLVLAPGAVCPDGRGYCAIQGQPDLVEALKAGSLPDMPPGIAELIRRRARSAPHAARAAGNTPPTPRERAYGKAALRRVASDLASVAPGTRNTELNKAAFILGTMVGRDWLTRAEVEDALRAAMDRNGYVADKGTQAVEATLASGLSAGLVHPHDDLPEQGITLDDFVSHAPSRMYFFLPCREPWPGASVNARLPKIEVTTADGERKEVVPTAWLDVHRSVEQMTWAPGEPMLIPGKLFVAAGGWVERPGVVSLNHYRPPLIVPGNAAEADPWLEHVHKVYPEDADHIICWLAHRVQRPAEKINHNLVLGGLQGIGKDSLLEPARHAVGPWNMAEVSPVALLSRFNGFLKSVILRVSEAHDLGEYNRYALYERLKAYSAAPPDGLRVDEKHLREHTIVNAVGIVLTTNHRVDAIYLPADDRRHYVCWSELTKDDFVADYWRRLWGWYDAGGLRHVAAYLAELDISRFNPKAPRPRPRPSGPSLRSARRPRTASSPTCSTSSATPTPSRWHSSGTRPICRLTNGCATAAIGE